MSIIVDGIKYKSIVSFSNKFHANTNQVRNNFYNGAISKKELLQNARPSKKLHVTYNGVVYTKFSELEKATGISQSTLRSRHNLGFSDERLLMPPNLASKVTINGQVFTNLTEASEKLGIPRSTLSNHLDKNGENINEFLSRKCKK